MAITGEDEHLHARDDDPYWNESGWFAFNVPHRSLDGYLYFYHRPNLGYTIGGVALWDPSGDRAWNCLHYDFGDPYPMAADSDMFDFELPNGLAVHMVKEMRQFEFRYGYRQAHGLYENTDCKLDLQWEAVQPVMDIGLADGQEEWGPGHYEQPGHMTGQLVLAGEKIEIDCLAHRDRSWGRRRMTSNPRACMPWGIANADTAFQLQAIAAALAADDDGLGPDRVINGWYLKDGIYGRIDSGQRSIVDRGEEGRPLRAQIAATDHLGRKLEIEGVSKAALLWHGYTHMFQWWSLFEWRQGDTVFNGEDVDFWPLQQARKYIRNRGAASTK
jgi:hypothetical protein